MRPRRLADECLESLQVWFAVINHVFDSWGGFQRFEERGDELGVQKDGLRLRLFLFERARGIDWDAAPAATRLFPTPSYHEPSTANFSTTRQKETGTKYPRKWPPYPPSRVSLTSPEPTCRPDT
jgi:hypothetical protein